MAKKTTSLTIDAEVLDEAKEMGFNLSALSEDAIKKRLGKAQVEIDKPLKCEVCWRKGEKETAKDVEESVRKANESDSKGRFLPTENAKKSNLTWLWPDQLWICNACLLKRIKSISVAQ